MKAIEIRCLASVRAKRSNARSSEGFCCSDQSSCWSGENFPDLCAVSGGSRHWHDRVSTNREPCDRISVLRSPVCARFRQVGDLTGWRDTSPLVSLSWTEETRFFCFCNVLDYGNGIGSAKHTIFGKGSCSRSCFHPVSPRDAEVRLSKTTQVRQACIVRYIGRVLQEMHSEALRTRKFTDLVCCVLQLDPFCPLLLVSLMRERGPFR
jgi:hypothetical protein